MWFKNCQIFCLPAQWPLSLEALIEQLQRMQFQKCASNQPKSVGWVPPVKNGGLVHSVGGQWLLAYQSQERILPPSVVNDEVQERAEAQEETLGYALGRKQLKELKERVVEELLPRAFVRTRRSLVWIDPVDGWFVVDASSQGKAEDVIELLRSSLDQFPLSPLHTQLSTVSAMADWLASGEPPTGFTVDQDCELKAPDESKQTVRFVRHPLGDEFHANVKEHLAAGKLPTRLAMTWNDRISFMLTDKMELRRLAFLDVVQEEAKASADTAAEQLDADFALMTGELRRLLPAVVDALGGVAKDQAAAIAPAPGQVAL